MPNSFFPIIHDIHFEFVWKLIKNSLINFKQFISATIIILNRNFMTWAEKKRVFCSSRRLCVFTFHWTTRRPPKWREYKEFFFYGIRPCWRLLIQVLGTQSGIQSAQISLQARYFLWGKLFFIIIVILLFLKARDRNYILRSSWWFWI